MIDEYGIFQSVTNGLKGVLELDEEDPTSLSEGGGKTLLTGFGVGTAELALDCKLLILGLYVQIWLSLL